MLGVEDLSEQIENADAEKEVGNPETGHERQQNLRIDIKRCVSEERSWITVILSTNDPLICFYFPDTRAKIVEKGAMKHRFSYSAKFREVFLKHLF